MQTIQAKRERLRRLHASAISSMQERIEVLKHRHTQATMKCASIPSHENEEKLALKGLVKKQRHAKAQADRTLHYNMKRCEAQHQHSRGMHRSLSGQLHADIMRSYWLVNGWVRRWMQPFTHLNHLTAYLLPSVLQTQGNRARMMDVAFLPDEGLPKGGMGDCAAPKLLNEANTRGLQPEAIAETWMHPELPQGSGGFWNACKERCEPILGYLLCGVGYGSER
jgi:hypothetical protein